MLSDFAAGLPWALQRKVSAWALVQSIAGEKELAEVPPVIPFSNAQRTAFRYDADTGTSVNCISELCGSGHPAAAHRKETISALGQGSSGPNLLALTGAAT